MRGLKARAKMADVHEIRGASVTAQSSAPVRRSSPFRWLSTHPVANEPSRRGRAPRCRIVQDHQPPLHPHLHERARARARALALALPLSLAVSLPLAVIGHHSRHPPGRVHPRSAPRRPVSAKKCRASGQESAYCPARATPCVWQERAGISSLSLCQCHPRTECLVGHESGDLVQLAGSSSRPAEPTSPSVGPRSSAPERSAVVVGVGRR